MNLPFTVLGLLRDVTFGVVLLILFAIFVREGFGGLVRKLLAALRHLHGVDDLIGWFLRREVRGFLRQVDPQSFSSRVKREMAIPEKGVSESELLSELEKCKKAETDPHSGKIFAYVYTSQDSSFEVVSKALEMFANFGKDDSVTPASDLIQDHESKSAVVKLFLQAFLHENALNALVFPSLRKFETETVAMVANMLHGDANCVGSVTSGGTESILTAVKTYRDRARKLFPSIKHPEIVAPLTIHPAFLKAANYFDLTVTLVPMTPDYRPDIDAFRKAISANTILLAASATEYCYGMVDPMEEISNIAVEKGLPLHVDSCIGGFMLPWVEKLGYNVPVFDFRLSGVTSMSADIHKYGLGAKGSSVVVYRSAVLRKYQIFACSEWPGGLFGSPTMVGSRPGAFLASSWAVLQCIGQEGYIRIAKQLMEVAICIQDGVKNIEGLFICGTPHMTILSIGSSDPKLDIFALADVMETKGWKIERQMSTLHCTILPSHTLQSASQFVEDLKEACQTVKANPSLSKKGVAGVYGMVGMVPDKSVVKDFVVEFFNEVYSM